MSPERWARITEMFEAALEKSPDERPRFLDQACGADPSLREEVGRLLAQPQDSWLKSPVETTAVPELSAGQVLGRYRVEAKLGQGGMGTVYKARDTVLRRSVALKVLPATRFADPENRQRLVREARAASALEHPNIITIHDIDRAGGIEFIAMEYLAGKTLDQVIASNGLRLRDALKFGVQIADALAAAHAAGIVHRDIKPSNIMVSDEGRVKVLDFGLAKLTKPDPGASSGSLIAPTGEGVILGTVAYMSPEQVRGEEVDHRSDIFSFGLVLYEMLSGRRAFQAKSAVEVMTAILKEEPLELPDTAASALRQIVAGCLEKDPAARFESARDLAFALRAFSSGSGISAAVAGPDTGARGPRGRWLLPALASTAVALAALSLTLYLTRPEPLDLSTYKFTPFATDAEPESFGSWSRDGKRVTYLKMIEGHRQLMVRSLDAPSLTQLTRLPSGVYPRSGPFFSPDGERVYFIASEALWSVAIVGGEPRRLLKAPMEAAALSPDGKTLVFWQRYEEAGKQYAGVWISSPPGAPPRKYEPAPFRVETGYSRDFLRFSPDGSWIGLAAVRALGEAWFWILPWPDGPNARPRQVFSTDSFRGAAPPFDWMPDSRHICLSTDGNLWLGDTGTGKLRQLTASVIGTAVQPSVSPGGERVLFTTVTMGYDLMELPLDGSPPRPLLATARNEISPSWSAAGDQLAFITDRSGESEIWLRNPTGGWERPAVRQSDFPNDPGDAFQCVTLSPDGTRIAYSRHGRLWVSPVSGGRGSPAVAGGELESGVPSWSPDSSSITYIGITGGKPHVAVTRVGSQEPQFLVPGTANRCASAPIWSPDARWIACGGYDQTVLLVSPDGKQRRSVPSPVQPTSFGFVLVWSRDGAAIYVASSGTGNPRLDVIDVRTGKSRKIAEHARDLSFETPTTYSLFGSLSRDGKSFATTAMSIKSDLWILQGFPRPRRHWF